MRKTLKITIPETVEVTEGESGKETKSIVPNPSRDRGKTFLLTEMSASRTEDFATRTILALIRSGADVPEGFMDSGIAGLTAFGLQGLTSLSFDEAKPLLDEMMDCIVLCPDKKHPEVTRPLGEDDIEEVATRVRLKAEVIKLHVGFSLPGANSKGRSQTTTNPPGSATTSTSPEQSAP